MKITDKIEKILSMDDCNDCFAVPGETLIDVLHPVTGLTVCYGKTLSEVQAKYPSAVKMTVEEFCTSKAAWQDSPITWTETTEEKYYEMLEVLPPEVMVKGGFLVGEPWDHHALTGRSRFSGFLHRGGKWMTSSRPITLKEFMAIANPGVQPDPSKC